MRNYWLTQTKGLKNEIRMHWNDFSKTLQHYWLRALVLGIIVLLLWQKDLSFQFDLSASRPIASLQQTNFSNAPQQAEVVQSAISFDFINDLIPQKAVEKNNPKPPSPSVAEQQNLSNTYSNMAFQTSANPSPAAQKNWTSKKKKQEAYVKRFAKVAQAEMKKYKIPASIKLAQGLIESNAGDSRLSRKNNNHFGMKCFSKKCKKGHCSNFTDDSHKDFFRVYNTSWESYRAHSHLLNGKRYKHLKGLGNNYKAWAHGLKKAGYATDKRYAEKLIQLIERLKLDRYDT